MYELEHEEDLQRCSSENKFLPIKRFCLRKRFFFAKTGGYIISIQEFIEQEKTFLERTLKEQFSLALKAFEAQEGAHATAYGHTRLIKNTFGSINAEEYLRSFAEFRKNILNSKRNDDLKLLLEESEVELNEKMEIIEQYSGFLTHTDFVPHNIRVVGENYFRFTAADKSFLLLITSSLVGIISNL